MRNLNLGEHKDLGEAVSDVVERASEVDTAHDNFLVAERLRVVLRRLVHTDHEDEEHYKQSFCDIEYAAEALRDETATLLKKIREIKAEATRKPKEYFDEGNEEFEDG